MKRSFNTAAASLFAAAACAGSAHAQTFTTDVKVQGSLCVGIDCSSSESFGFDTIRLKENNLRIKFQDTSNSASFPSNDWQITANDSSNGGANKFSIDDIDGGRTPFTIEASAPSNSIYADDGGRIGLGTSTPVVELHVVDGDTPTMRLEQDGSSGFSPQTWDLAGNETNFFVRDASNGSRLPFKILPAAPTNALVIAENGEIGVGAGTNPAADFHIQGADDVQLLVEETGVGFAQLLALRNNGAPRILFENTNTTGEWQIGMTDPGDGFVFRDITTSTNALIILPNGDATLVGTLTQGSDKNRKIGIEPVDPKEILAKVQTLPVSTWTYTHDADTGVRHIGPMAQDFYELFGTGADETGISTIDTAGVALASIKALSLENAELRARLDRLENTLKDE